MSIRKGKSTRNQHSQAKDSEDVPLQIEMQSKDRHGCILLLLSSHVGKPIMASDGPRILVATPQQQVHGCFPS